MLRIPQNTLHDRQGLSSADHFADHFPGVREWEYPQVHEALREYFTTGSREMVHTEEELDLDGLLAELDGVDSLEDIDGWD